MHQVTRELPGRPDLLAAAAAWPGRYPGLLESVAGGAASARWDILFASDGEAIVQARPDPQQRFLDRLDAAWRAAQAARGDAGLPFRGGWLLLLGYELATECEPRLRLPLEPALGPTAIALRSPAAALYDHARDRTILVAEPGATHWLDRLQHDLAAAPPLAPGNWPGVAVAEELPGRFLDGVRRVHEYLAAGDVFQVNLSRAWRADLPSAIDPVALYQRLRATNPAPFAGLFRHDGLAVLSSSPERLVQVAGRRVQTRPIAGTRPRLAGDDEGARVRELVDHPKERAEHVMLIDLERNDLGRVCVPGSVVVDEMMTVESYTHVHHLVSNVRGTLRAGVTPGQVIRAVFPGGTITGCPKVRCMEIIAELEGEPRGPYTGSLGYLNRDGDLDLNILIRTIAIAGQRVVVRAGSGLVADSVAERELDETRAKARGVLAALQRSAQ
ncbi:MAG TPA: aminodeoxychorismate synthase component I [Pseudomonadota bacterium]|nr:aminodeoxychorismate synthase component I [Pseudomonadota bacterium]